jgi:hypothetical protein
MGLRSMEYASLFIACIVIHRLTPKKEALTAAALQATKEHGLIVDFALGPNQGSGVPAEYDDPGVMWDLWPFNV